MTFITQQPHINPQYSLKLLNKLLLHHITTIAHITIPNGLHLMTPQDFKYFYSNPTNLITHALYIAEQLFCHPSCLPIASTLAPITFPHEYFLPQYITINHYIIPPLLIPCSIHSPYHLSLAHSPQNASHNPTQYPITIILQPQTS
jgi:hypothetical protein